MSKSRTLWRKIDRCINRTLCTMVARENVPAMERFLEGRAYDVAYCFGLHRVSLAITEPIRRRGIPILWHAGDGFIVDHLQKWPRRIPGYWLAMQLFARRWYSIERRGDYRNIAFVSQFLRDYFHEHGIRPARGCVIPRGVDFPLARDVERERDTPPVLFMACRIDPEKGIHHAIAAAGLIARKRPELAWRLDIAGVAYSEYGDKLRRQAEKEGVGGRVTFLGHLPRADVLEKMRRATAFLSCATYGEPFAGTIIEALASGTPLIGSDAGSILEVVRPGESALVYSRERPEELAAHIEALLDNPASGRSLARAGLAVIENRYTEDRILDQTEAALTRVIEEAKS